MTICGRCWPRRAVFLSVSVVFSLLDWVLSQTVALDSLANDVVRQLQTSGVNQSGSASNQQDRATSMATSQSPGIGVSTSAATNLQAPVKDFRPGEDRPRCSAAFLVAADGGDLPQLMEVLDTGESAGCVDEGLRAPLHYAAQANRTDAAVYLLKRGARFDRDAFGRSALHDASNAGHVSMAQLLLSANAYIELTDVVLRRPLHYAARGGHRSVVDLLADSGAKINEADVDNRTALHYSCRSDAFKNVTLELLSRGADINLQDVVGFTPLHFACFENMLETVKVLLNQSADLYTLDRAGWNPLTHAAANGFAELVDWLVIYMLQPEFFPLPDPAGFDRQDMNKAVFLGLPGYLLAVGSVVAAFICCICPAMFWLRRFARLHNAYVVTSTDEELEEFIREVFDAVMNTGSHDQMCAEWDQVPVHTLQDLHRVKNKE